MVYVCAYDKQRFTKSYLSSQSTHLLLPIPYVFQQFIKLVKYSGGINGFFGTTFLDIDRISFRQIRYFGGGPIPYYQNIQQKYKQYSHKQLQILTTIQLCICLSQYRIMMKFAYEILQFHRIYIIININCNLMTTEIKNKKNAIAGYMGYIPSNEDKDQGTGVVIDSHIPGYVGYIPAVKSQNIYAHTYGKVTQNCAKGNYPKGIQFPPDIKYKSTTKDTYVDPNSIKEQQLLEGKISGVKMSTFSNAAKLMMTTGSLKKNQSEFEVVTKLTYEQACKKAFG